MAWLFFSPFQGAKLQLSIQFLGYTNASHGMHIGAIQVSNASPFAVVRGRSPMIVFDSSSAKPEHAPTGWSVLQPGECEQIQTEPLINGIRWRIMVVGERLGRDQYGIGRESQIRVRARQIAIWLQEHRIPAPLQSTPPGVAFSSDWIEP
jgi:hypothetical protein